MYESITVTEAPVWLRIVPQVAVFARSNSELLLRSSGLQHLVVCRNSLICCRYITLHHPEDEGSLFLRNVNIHDKVTRFL